MSDQTNSLESVQMRVSQALTSYPWYIGSYLGVPPGTREGKATVVVSILEGHPEADEILKDLPDWNSIRVSRMSQAPLPGGW